MNDPSSLPLSGDARNRMMAWVAGFLPPRFPRWLGVLALGLIATAMGLVQPLLTKELIDNALPDRDMHRVLQVCAALFALSVVGAGLGLVNRLAYVRVSGELLFALREFLFRHLMSLSPRWMARAREGDLLSRLDGDVAEVQRFVLDGALSGINACFALLGAVVAMASLSPVLTLLALAVLPLQLALVSAVRPRIERQTREVRRRAADLGAFFFETLPAAKHIQATFSQDYESARLSRLNNAYLEGLLKQERIGFWAGAAPSLMMSAATALIFVFGASNLLGESLSIGAMVAFTSYLGRAAGPLQSLMGLWVASRRAVVSLDRLGELVLLEPEVRSPTAPQVRGAQAEGRLEIKDVTLRHGAHQVFSHFSATIAAGERVALLGPSGSGKSSLADLLVRHYDPDGGEILLDGLPLPNLALEDVRRTIAVVPQEVILMPGAIAANVAYGCPTATRAEIAAALDAAGLSDWIAALPAGMDSEVGNHGRLLSGGQRQRLAIARALLLHPQVLILDEATTGLEPALQTTILDTIDQLFAACTRILISHDPAVLREGTRILHLPAA